MCLHCLGDQMFLPTQASEKQIMLKPLKSALLCTSGIMSTRVGQWTLLLIRHWTSKFPLGFGRKGDRSQGHLTAGVLTHCGTWSSAHFVLESSFPLLLSCDWGAESTMKLPSPSQMCLPPAWSGGRHAIWLDFVSVCKTLAYLLPIATYSCKIRTVLADCHLKC